MNVKTLLIVAAAVAAAMVANRYIRADRLLAA